MIYIVTYATNNPFEQFTQTVNMNDEEKDLLLKVLEDGVTSDSIKHRQCGLRYLHRNFSRFFESNIVEIGSKEPTNCCSFAFGRIKYTTELQ